MRFAYVEDVALVGAMQECDQQALVLARAVMAYLEEHPMAMDTRNGIAEWWVAGRVERVDLQILTAVLEDLTLRGLLVAEGMGEQTRYRMKSPPP